MRFGMSNALSPALASAAGLGRYQMETLIRMFQYYERYGFEGSPGVLTWLLGRPPTPLSAFAARSNDR